jgi:hypothetical protein
LNFLKNNLKIEEFLQVRVINRKAVLHVFLIFSSATAVCVYAGIYGLTLEILLGQSLKVLDDKTGPVFSS